MLTSSNNSMLELSGQAEQRISPCQDVWHKHLQMNLLLKLLYTCAVNSVQLCTLK